MIKKEPPLYYIDENTDNEAPSLQLFDGLSTKTETTNDMKNNMSCD